MHHIRIAPSGSGPWPIVVTIPPVLFFTNGGPQGTPAQRAAAKELNDHGFLVFQIEHRLAPPNTALGQTEHDKTPRGIASGRPPQQTDDVKQQILAAMADRDWDQENLFILGGSSGASHALWVALDSSNQNVTEWTETVRSKIKGVVGFSGLYDLHSRDYGDPGSNFDPETYLHVIQNYTNTTDNFVGLEFQFSVSPQTLVSAATNIPPIRLYATVNDTIPHNQSENMRDALLNHGGVDVMEYTIEGNAHCFNQWYIENTNTYRCVREEVIAFLEAQL